MEFIILTTMVSYLTGLGASPTLRIHPEDPKTVVWEYTGADFYQLKIIDRYENSYSTNLNKPSEFAIESVESQELRPLSLDLCFHRDQNLRIIFT